MSWRVFDRNCYSLSADWGCVKVAPFSLAVWWGWAHLVHWQLFGLLYRPQMMHDDERGAVGGMRIGRGNGSTQRKPAPVPLCPSQIPHDLTWAQTWATTVGSWLLINWAMAWPCMEVKLTFSDQTEWSALCSTSVYPLNSRTWWAHSTIVVMRQMIMLLPLVCAFMTSDT
jgi:hypothetical protein